MQEHKSKLLESLHVFEELGAWIQNSENKDHNYKYWLITINYGKSQFKALIDWCEESIEALRS
ncbi:hypothetical protein ACFQ3W_03415 [Paenibacillus puldeungensis]|uniref:Transcription regulator PadR C-terminal domain-containing protein n=1 Tax=Paenibacillus puldeungensis TaxID=696536 RepID=A0ABW3RS95_9BACL